MWCTAKYAGGDSCSLPLMARHVPSGLRACLCCGALAAPVFVSAFTAIGASRPDYDWRRYPVSSLALGQQGWLQRCNFIVVGVLYCCAAKGLRHASRQRVGPRVPTLVASAGLGLIGSGVFVTDPVGGFPPVTSRDGDSGGAGSGQHSPTREGKLHNLCAIPIFAGIPLAGLTSAAAAGRSRDYRWACFSALSSLGMVASFVLFGRASGGGSRLAGKGGIFQRASIAFGSGWLTALSLRSLRDGH